MKKLLFLFTFIIVLVTSGFSTQAATQKVVKIASDNSYAPFEFQNSNKQWTGIDVDIIKQVAKENNWKLEISYPGFDAAVNDLKSGQVDGVIAGMSITDARKQVFDFSNSYYTSALAIATTKEKPISDYSQIKGKAVGVKNGTAAQAWLQANKSKYGYTITTYADGAHMYAALQAGNVAAIMDDYPVISYAIHEGQDLAVNLPSTESSGYGFAVVKGKNSDLIKEFNATLAKMKKDGQYQAILNKYIQTDTKKATPKKAVYVIDSDNSFAPFEFQNSKKQYTGIDIDLLNAIAKDQGFTLKWNFVGFAPAVSALQAGQADAVMSGMTITDARKATFDFSNPYYQDNLTLATLESNTSIKSWSDLKGKTVGVKNGTTANIYLTEHQKEYGYTIKTFQMATDMYQALNAGSVVAVADDEPVVQYAIKQGEKYKTPLKPINDGYLGFAVKKGTNPELIQMFNNGLADLKANGEYTTIIDKYVGAKATTTSSTQNDENTTFGILKNNWQQLLQGLLLTLELAIVSFVLALVVGIIFGLFSIVPSKILRGIARVYIDVNRAVPLLILIVFLFYGVPNLLQMITGHQSPLNAFVAGVIALTLNESSYIAEQVRGGINAVPIGQMEASRSLGVPYVKTLRKIILPQAVKIVIPSLVNQFVITLKDTTLVSAIGLTELLQTGQIIVARNFQYFRVFGILLVFYAVVLLLLMYLGRIVERKMK